MIDPLRNRALAQEEDRLPWRTLLLAFFLTGLIGLLLVAWAWYRTEAREQALRPSGAFPERELGPLRAVSQVFPDVYGEAGPGQKLNLRKKLEISRFRWVDRTRRVVSIPIDDAMTLLVEGSGP